MTTTPPQRRVYRVKACVLTLVLGTFARVYSDGPSALRPYATLLGGTGVDSARAIARGPDGSLYLAGLSSSFDFPELEDDVQGVDAIVVKLTPELDEIERVVTLGGPGRDEAVSIDVTPAGRIIVAGVASAGFPTTEGAFQTENAGSARYPQSI